MEPISQVSVQLPVWMSSKTNTFIAKDSVTDRIANYVNKIIVGVGLCGVFAPVIGLNVVVYVILGCSILATRKIVSAAIGYAVYHAARNTLMNSNGAENQSLMQRTIKLLERDGYHAKEITFSKSGIEYNGLAIGHASTINNGLWTIHALGNMQFFENFISTAVFEDKEFKSNTLLINGPSVSSSKGFPTRYQFGAGFEAGLQFLEQEVKSSHILMTGLSLGAGMMAEGILIHDFKKKSSVKYLSICDRSFAQLKLIASDIQGNFVLPFFYFSGQDLDTVAAAKKLSGIGITTIAIQHCATPENSSRNHDFLIRDHVGTACGLKNENLPPNSVVYLESPDITHGGELPWDVRQKKHALIQNFFNS